MGRLRAADELFEEPDGGPSDELARLPDRRDRHDRAGADLERANDIEFGLAAYLFTASADRVRRLPRLLDVGMVTINRFGVGARDTFFGGRKKSGFGSEGGQEAVQEYMVKKLVAQGVA
jgi:succinate-semialdehyde dehydrogenase/glutarate-semialdehyde dehydrogenase